MIGREFVEWLQNEKKYSHKAAMDAASRCRRAERLFNIKLGNAVRSETGLNAMLTRLKTEKSTYVKKGMNSYAVKANLTLAIRLYHQFVSQNQTGT